MSGVSACMSSGSFLPLMLWPRADRIFCVHMFFGPWEQGNCRTVNMFTLSLILTMTCTTIWCIMLIRLGMMEWIILKERVL